MNDIINNIILKLKHDFKDIIGEYNKNKSEYKTRYGTQHERIENIITWTPFNTDYNIDLTGKYNNDGMFDVDKMMKLYGIKNMENKNSEFWGIKNKEKLYKANLNEIERIRILLTINGEYSKVEDKIYVFMKQWKKWIEMKSIMIMELLKRYDKNNSIMIKIEWIGLKICKLIELKYKNWLNKIIEEQKHSHVEQSFGSFGENVKIDYTDILTIVVYLFEMKIVEDNESITIEEYDKKYKVISKRQHNIYNSTMSDNIYEMDKKWVLKQLKSNESNHRNVEKYSDKMNSYKKSNVMEMIKGKFNKIVNTVDNFMDQIEQDNYIEYKIKYYNSALIDDKNYYDGNTLYTFECNSIVNEDKFGSLIEESNNIIMSSEDVLKEIGFGNGKDEKDVNIDDLLDRLNYNNENEDVNIDEDDKFTYIFDEDDNDNEDIENML